MVRWKKFLALGGRDKLFLCRAWCLLGCYRLAVLCLPLHRLAGPLATAPRHAPIASAQLAQAVQVGRLIAAAARFTPWRSRCLEQVLVARRELARRRIPGRICLGVHRSADDARLAAHAWLQCGDTIVSGAASRERYTLITSSGWEASGT